MTTQLALLAGAAILALQTYTVYKPLPEGVDMGDKPLTGIYTVGEYGDMERKTAPMDIYIAYMNQGSPFPGDFVTLCSIRKRLPLIVYRPTDYDVGDIPALVSHVAGYNMPLIIQVDASYSESAKDFFRELSCQLHRGAPEALVVWGIGDKRVEDIPTLYPGDEYVDMVALNIFEGADRKGLNIDPYPLHLFLSYFQASKPLMLNASVASYTEDGHKYLAYEAAGEIERLYTLANNNGAIAAVNYISRTTSEGNALGDNCEAVMRAIGRAVSTCSGSDRLPLALAYKHDGHFYTLQDSAVTEDEWCIIEGKKYYRVKGGLGYTFRGN